MSSINISCNMPSVKYGQIFVCLTNHSQPAKILLCKQHSRRGEGGKTMYKLIFSAIFEMAQKHPPKSSKWYRMVPKTHKWSTEFLRLKETTNFKAPKFVKKTSQRFGGSSQKHYKKNPAYGRHQLSWPMRIVGPIQIWRGCVIYIYIYILFFW